MSNKAKACCSCGRLCVLGRNAHRTIALAFICDICHKGVLDDREYPNGLCGMCDIEFTAENRPKPFCISVETRLGWVRCFYEICPECERVMPPGPFSVKEVERPYPKMLCDDIESPLISTLSVDMEMNDE